MFAAWSEALQALEQSPWAGAIRSTPYLYPGLMALHVIGIALLLGAAVVVDLRLLGVGRAAVPVRVVLRHLLPMAHVGFAVIALTGAAMFVAMALTVGQSAAAPWKLGLIALAGLNLGVFHRGVLRTVAQWDMHRVPPWPARVAALVSLASWSATVFAGRLLSY